MKKIITGLLVVLTILPALATHNRSGELLYERIQPYANGSVPVYNFRITLVKYTDDGPAVADRCSDTIYFGDGTKGLATRINGTTGSCSCGADPCGVLLVNQPGYKVKKSIYTVTHTYNGPGNYTVRYSDPFRTPGSANIPNSGTVAFSLEALIRINTLSDINSSPVLTIAPVDQATVGVCFYHNLGAVDADGDSISYSPTACLGNGGSPVPGYVYPGYGTATTYSFGATGTLTWCAPSAIGEYNLAVYVIEWRKNTSGTYQQIGAVMRDMQILVNAGIVGIKENSLNSGIAVFPNPFTTQLDLDLPGGSGGTAEFALFSTDGKVVSGTVMLEAGAKNKLSTEHLEPGIYLLRIKTAEGISYKKMVKE